jgi:hypothetical protein
MNGRWDSTSNRWSPPIPLSGPRLASNAKACWPRAGSGGRPAKTNWAIRPCETSRLYTQKTGECTIPMGIGECQRSERKCVRASTFSIYLWYPCCWLRYCPNCKTRTISTVLLTIDMTTNNNNKNSYFVFSRFLNQKNFYICKLFKLKKNFRLL